MITYLLCIISYSLKYIKTKQTATTLRAWNILSNMHDLTLKWKDFSSANEYEIPMAGTIEVMHKNSIYTTEIKNKKDLQWNVINLFAGFKNVCIGANNIRAANSA